MIIVIGLVVVTAILFLIARLMDVHNQIKGVM